MTGDAPRPGNLPPGYDEDDPYEDADLDEYPSWWRRNVEEFRSYGLRPYRPPRFDDGELVTPLVDTLERDLDVDIRLRAINPQDGNDWELLVDGDRVATLEHSRESEGYSLYRIDSATFESRVRAAACED